jgi:hypothetical protein
MLYAMILIIDPYNAGLSKMTATTVSFGVSFSVPYSELNTFYDISLLYLTADFTLMYMLSILFFQC